MKYINKFEKKKYLSISEEVEIGDYVIITSDPFFTKNRPKNVVDYIATTIGQIKDKGPDSYIVKFDNPPEFNSGFDKSLKTGWTTYENEILFFSPNKEELEMKLAAQKYNLL